VLTLHPWLATADAPRRPVRLVFDLDPPSGSDFGAVVFAATALRELLDELGLPGYPMTTGSRGMHVAVPLAGREDVDDVRDGARRIADTLAARHPDRLTTKVRKASRQGRLFVDTLRNAYAQHAVAPYSPRPLPGAPVAMPVSWDEVAGGEVAARGFRLRDVATRLSTVDDPWAGMARRARTLAPALRRLPD
jgi:bifunctional non-homologous end joining protein LigD